ncbi:MAG: M20/M25/M40 family metallo-hydrolase [candidate division WOR-3 bacterium]
MNFLFFLLISQTYNPDIAQIIEKVQVDSVYKNILRLQNFWTRHYKSDSMYKSRLWIKERFQNYGYNLREHIFFYGNREQANIIAKKVGFIDTLKPIVICAHYDSRGQSWSNPPYGPAPGADDNASGVSLLIEIARVIKDIDFDYTIKFIAFAAEEPGLIGSTQLANYYRQNNKKIKYLLNADMIGGDIDFVNNTVVIEYDMGNQVDTNNSKSFAFAETLKTIYNLYLSSLNTTYGNIFASDYMPFEAYGYTTLGVFEKNFNSGYHTTRDVVDSLDINYATNIIKGVLAFILHTAKFHTVIIREKEVVIKSSTFREGIYDITGRKVDFKNFKSGIYILKKNETPRKILRLK